MTIGKIDTYGLPGWGRTDPAIFEVVLDRHMCETNDAELTIWVSSPDQTVVSEEGEEWDHMLVNLTADEADALGDLLKRSATAMREVLATP